jgi:23S rRNA (uracil1939-C5)-methyltransferase
MVILITREPESEDEKDFAENFWTLLPDGYHYEAVHAVNSTPNPRHIDRYTVLNGKGYIMSRILGVEFRVSPFTFFQTNTSQLDPFLGKAIDEAQIETDDVVWDLYCGTGSLSLPSARKAKKVIGIELVEESIEFARENAKLNGIENTEFHATDLHTKQLPELFSELDRPDIIITDPPRAGMHQNMVEHILAVAPRRVVYVSCNPATQARDLALMADSYEINKVTPVDLFPHTYHIESIAVLERRNTEG